MTSSPTIDAVYTAGKAATTTTHRTLAKHLPDLLDLRRGSEEGIAEYVSFARRADPSRPLRTDELRFQERRRKHPDARLRLVSLTREPVAAAVSSWFFNFENRVEDARPEDWTTEQHVDAICAGGFASRPDYFTGWFDFECRELTGIDVYERAFDVEQGFDCYGVSKADLLVIRSEDLSAVFRTAFERFYGLTVPALEAHNVGDTSTYATAYKQFKTGARLPPGFVDEHLAHRYARHFYSTEELDRFRTRWISGPDGVG